jgi:HK97 family phage prohead protease
LKIEIRNDSVHISGYVNVVERDSRILPSPRGKFIEQVRAKTFQRALERTDNVDLLFNHKSDRKLGSTKEATLKLWEDNIGLRAEADITDMEVIQKAKNKELRGWSFAFHVLPNGDKWEEGKDGIQRRYLEDISLPEVSILSVTPAYIATSIEARGEEIILTELRNIEEDIEIEDNSTIIEEEKREENPIIDYSIAEQELELLKIKQIRH